MVVAVMQPYFFPYAGYFRLLAAAETFVVFDTAQFTRRGRIHRSQVPDRTDRPTWLTLPLERQPRETTIAQQRFAPDARRLLDARLQRFAWLAHANGPLAAEIRAYLSGSLDDPCAFVVAGLSLVAERLRLPAKIVRSSQLDVPRATDNQRHIADLVRAAGGSTYLSSPGGRALYDGRTMRGHGVDLAFLSPYDGRFPYMLRSLVDERPQDLRDDIARTSVLEP